MKRLFCKSDDCLLLVIDIQQRLYQAMEDAFKDIFIKNSAILIEVADVCNIPIIVSEQYPRGLGKTIDEVEKALPHKKREEKLYFSCYREEPIKTKIDSSGKKTVIVIGIETHVCVLQTVLDLLEADYRVVVATDAVCSRRQHDRLAALNAVADAGAVIYPTETIAFMLMEKAGTPLFKQLSPLFK